MLPLALATPAWTALAAAGGAIAGALAGGIADAVVDRRREGRLAKAGARLVAEDLMRTIQHIQLAVKDGRWFRDTTFSRASWDEYRAVLAAELSARQFNAVVLAVEGLDRFARGMYPEQDWEAGQRWMKLPEGVKPHMNEVASVGIRGWDALVELTGQRISEGPQREPI